MTMTESRTPYTIAPGCGVTIGPVADDWTHDPSANLEARSAELSRIEALLEGHGTQGETAEERVRNLIAAQQAVRLWIARGMVEHGE
jgi:hypothetical protein